MDTLNSIFQKATREHWALGHFNISNLEILKAIVGAVEAQGTYPMIGLSEGERKHVGLKQVVALAKTYEEELGIPMFLNADHSKSIESACAAADAGFTSIHIDASQQPYDKNVEMTRSVVEYVKKISPDISVEGELGFIPGESKVENKNIVVDEALYTNPDSVADFVQKTGVHRLAIFVGNVHGLHKTEPKLDIERIRRIRANVPEEVALVLHAGSGIPDADIKAAIQAGISNIHISTELRVVFTDSLRKFLNEHPEETTPYKISQEAIKAVQSIAERKIIVFGGEHRV